MLILVAGANGQIGRQLLRRIKLSRNHSRAMIRDAGQSDALRTLGADETIVADLEGDVRPAPERSRSGATTVTVPTAPRRSAST